MDGRPADQDAYIENAVRAVQNRKQVPEIDFTLHTMEDGSQVSTQERVCKGMHSTDHPMVSSLGQSDFTTPIR